MACLVPTPKLKEIASQLNLPLGRVVNLASLSGKSDNWTKEDIQAELAKQKESKYGEFSLMGGVIYDSPANANGNLIRSDKDGNIIIAPPEDTLETLHYLKALDPSLSNEELAKISNLLNRYNDSSKVFLNYLAEAWIATKLLGQPMHTAILGAIKQFEGYSNYVKTVLPAWRPFSKKLSQQQQDQLHALLGPYDEGGGANINELFKQPLPNDIDFAITDFNMGDGELLTRDMVMWIVTNIKDEYKNELSSFYTQQATSNPKTIEYTPVGKQRQTYTIVGDKIINKEGKEVFAEDSVDRNKIFANLAVQEKRAVVVEHNGHQYVVNNRQQIISVISGKIMQWGEENGDRKAILELASPKLAALSSPAQSTQEGGNENTSSTPTQQEQVQTLASFSRDQVQQAATQENTPTNEGNVIASFSVSQAKQEVVELAKEDKKPTMPLPQAHVDINNVNSNNNPRVEFHRTFTGIERNAISNALSTEFSLVVDSMIKEALPKDKINEDSRKKFIVANYQAIKDRMKELYMNYLTNPSSRVRDQRLGQDFIDRKILYITKMFGYNPVTEESEHPEFFDILMQDASINLSRTENVEISANMVKEPEQTESTENQAEEDPEDSPKDGWMIKVRELDPRATLSSRVKKVLASTPKLDSNGKPVIDCFGRPEMINADYAHAVLINELSKIAYVADFVKIENGELVFPALEKMQTKYPWVKSIINKFRLEFKNTSNMETASQFFTDFRKDFISYTSAIEVYVEDDKGKVVKDEHDSPVTKIVTKDLNEAVAVESTLTDITNNYELGLKLNDTPIYSYGQVNAENRAKVNKDLVDLDRQIKDGVLNFNEHSDKIFSTLVDILRSAGVNVQIKDLVALQNDEDFNTKFDTLLDKLSVILSKKVRPDAHLINTFKDAYTGIAEIIGTVSEAMNVQTFRVGDTTYPNYSASNYVNTMVKRLADEDVQRRTEYIREQFKKFDWFYDAKNKRWRNGWLDLLENDDYVREHFKIQNMNVITSIENGEKPYEQWTEEDILKAFITQYFAYPINKRASTQFAKYSLPIYSDSPVMNFITMPRYTGDNYKEVLLDKLVDVAEQELLVRMEDIARRQQLVKEGKLSKNDLIANYDKQGNKFLFFPALNNIPNFQEEVRKAYRQGNVDEARRMLADAIKVIMDEGAEELKRKAPMWGRQLIDQGVVSSEDEIDNALEEYYWNEAYATTQIIQLTTTDLAYYKNGVDFQKRFKEIYAAGNKLNTASKYGKTKERVLYLKDEEIPSVSLPQIKEVLDQAVKEGRITELDSEAILSKFKSVNVADAQAYRSIESMRSVLDMMGQWTPKMEEAINKFKDGNWTIADFSMIWQTIKPFMFTQIEDRSGGTIRKVPHQNKNSEFLLLAMHSLIAASNIGKSPILKTLNEFMVNNDVDVVMFESAVKAGGQSVVTIKDGMDEATVATTLENSLKNPSAIKEFDYEDYVIQQPTPEHLIDHRGIYGSQFRNLIVSDITDGAEFTIRDGKGTRKIGKQELLKLYQGAIVENLLEDYRKIKGKFASIESLQKALLESIKGNPKYGKDVEEALQIVDGRFNIPLHCPAISDNIQEIINSFFKSQITKQKIKGGNAILVSDFGFVEELKCIYDTDENGKKHLKGVECYLPAYSQQFYEPFLRKDKDGNDYLDIEMMKKECPELLEAVGYRIPTEDKYSMVPLVIKGFLPQANGSAIMLPADITVHAGSDFDVDKLYLMLPEFKVHTHNLRKAREDFKKINNDESVNSLLNALFQDKGVDIDIEETPQDFKEWFKEHANEYKYDRPRVVKVNYDHSKDAKHNSRAQRNNLLIDIARGVLTNADTVDKFVNPGSFDKLKRTARISDIADNDRLYYQWRHKQLASLPEQIKTEQDPEKKAKLEAKLRRIRKQDQVGILSKALLDPEMLTDDDLKEIAAGEERDPLSPVTFAYYHKQNMTGGALIGMYANNTTLFSKFQSYDQSKPAMSLKFSFTLNGVSFSRLDGITSPHGERISKNCAEFSAASVDNVKDPVLAKLMQNTNTANLTALMLRLGMSIEEIGLIFTQPVIKQWIETCVGQPMYADNFAIIIALLTPTDELANYYEAIGGSQGNFEHAVLEANHTTESLVGNKIALSGGTYERLTSIAENPNLELDKMETDLLKSQLKLLLLVDQLYTASKQLNKITKVSRADSPNGAIDISIVGNLIQLARVENLRVSSAQEDWMIAGSNIYDSNVTADKEEDALRNAILNSRFPMLQAFYSLGIEFAKDIMKDENGNPYFIQHSQRFVDAFRYLNAIAGAEVLSPKNANAFSREFITYAVSDLPMFGGENFNRQRDFYLTQFPSRYARLIAGHPELSSYSILSKIKPIKGSLMFEKGARLTPLMKEGFKAELEDLLNGNPIERQLAIDLFVYSYYKDGLNFGPNSFSHLFSTKFINQIAEYTDGLKNIETADMDNFTSQFILNHPFVLPKAPDEEDLKEQEHQPIIFKSIKKGEMVLRTMYSTNPILRTPQPYYVEFIEGEGVKVWVLQNHGSDTATYKMISAANTSLGLRYNKGMSLDELSSFKVTTDDIKAYHDLSLEYDADYIDQKPLVAEDPIIQQEEKKYDSTTNPNKEDFCK